jgi:hypothetical protein
MSKRQADDAQGNWLLGAMESASRKRIDPHLEPIKFKLGAVVCEAGGLLKHAYFPQGAVLSLLTVLENGSAIETANIGREGAFGLFAAMYSRVSFNRCLVQLEGGTLRCPIEVLQSEFKRSEHVRDLFVSYSETLLSQVQQTVACNALHTTEERMCRWLLTPPTFEGSPTANRRSERRSPIADSLPRGGDTPNHVFAGCLIPTLRAALEH